MEISLVKEEADSQYSCSSLRFNGHINQKVLENVNILGQKGNAAYKACIVYGGSFTNLVQTICHSLSADSWIMNSWGCPGYHCHWTKLICQFKSTFLSILMSRH